ncbi:urease accessory protein UreD [Acinetobacter indicus]|uniref:urease accessory protein UreD n=1 Tax=Acinetobacter indicus TaxID=756892 RepID=UPI0009489899|nr:urease accessory protein UreD [Acinetobacter indicus]MCO8101359.1 urease accessory protein UreD [Acinetobacter indicus]MDM1244071.1 urease accessory protein UreD [Acinetobacter indicus]MDM1269297.1 urease accessory protein UreD [Acinetobacter indicus]MDM1288124.1 urease accessory protein UreD [Acinetobacter indicus]
MNQLVATEVKPAVQYWFAQLELGFKGAKNRTVLEHRKHHGPVRVQKMLWPEKTGVCHAIIVHPPAGIAGGDHLTFQMSAEQAAHALVTTPGAGKWYKTNQKQAFQHIDITVKDTSIFEWLPQETMLFNGANANSETRVVLEDSASFIGWDMLVLGRQARHETFTEGSYQNRFQLYRNNKLLVTDRLSFSGNDRWLSSCLGMSGHAVMASFWAVPPEKFRSKFYLDQQIDQIRELIMRMDIKVRLTLLDDVVTARYLGDDVRQCHDAFAAIRAKLRRDWFDLDEEFPRIWRT